MTTNDSREPASSIFAEASEWFVNFREGDVDAGGQARFNAWLKKSPEHIHAYMEVAALWSDVPQLAAGIDVDVDVETVVAYARNSGNVASIGIGATARASATTPAILPRRRKSKRRLLAAIAATLAACSVLIAWWQLSRASLYETGIGEQRLIALTDGSTVELTARSRLRVHMTEAERRIELLAGQALFKVSKDPARPFIVASKDVSVRAVGTQFDVHRRSSGTIVTVLEGRVSVMSKTASTLAPTAGEVATGDQRNAAESPSSPALYLSAGQQIVVPEVTEGSAGAVAHSSPPRQVDPAQMTRWADRTLNFENEALGDVIEEFNRYNQQQLVLADESLASMRISGVFTATKPLSLLRFLEEQMQLQVVVSDEQARIARRQE